MISAEMRSRSTVSVIDCEFRASSVSTESRVSIYGACGSEYERGVCVRSSGDLCRGRDCGIRGLDLVESEGGGTRSSVVDGFQGRGRLFLLTFIHLLLFPLLINCQQKLSDDFPNNSMFGKNVYVFDENMDSADIQNVLDCVHTQQAGQQFIDERIALLFKPGTYRNKVTVDYYVQALGLGR